jgi:hypothetical protein
MRYLSGIPILQPEPLNTNPNGPPEASPQSILQFKELEVDYVRYSAWKALVKRKTGHEIAPTV